MKHRKDTPFTGGNEGKNTFYQDYTKAKWPHSTSKHPCPKESGLLNLEPPTNPKHTYKRGVSHVHL